ncbi:cell division protein FtsZ [Leptospira borgpetersenii]|uniref:Cell division protein FtsZ n=1 Tax=Leptospira borgpetersenii serovar Pomona str. 200901868 TaxID=1192866 RepID=M6WB32_LEPBO|nr:cell division protein FtsZ [Leptospira borgpetersenii]EMO62424.1 cell division protein FtsZ [Leptospira borgpetersenii serovar Pomona str. 200901868]MBE8365539.1 cell division protein FtsZ [Leptospira borgpetersenii serovar Balcanica]MBE8368055.1 cell division protein FtsZ [Leptospira borgpetersenii serovar Balcanica]MBE8400572.1 cell division protein FtsZ [Leptospira borgpetersenii serovar Tarassovi]MBE8406251.1 cell division protein FtsZ [Leptospira borgpetersenii serovar Tarassovi]
MIRFEEEVKSSPAVIKVFGVGGGGMNAVARMSNSTLKGVEFTILNTDEQVLLRSPVENKIILGTKVTRGMGAGGDPELGYRAAEEDKERIQSSVRGADMVFVTAGMGGGTGTGAAPVIAKIAKEMKCLVVGVVTLPFSFEGRKRMELARKGIEQLRSHVDTLILINNDSIFKVVDKSTPIDLAFQVIDDILLNAVRGISDIINNPGLINVDFADVKAIMKDTGDAVMGVGEGSGEGKVKEAVEYAINNSLLDSASITGASSLLINVSGGKDLTISDWNEVSGIITSQVDPNANIIVGLHEDESLSNKIRVTVIATGFDRRFSSGKLIQNQDLAVKIQENYGFQKKVVGMENSSAKKKESFQDENVEQNRNSGSLRLRSSNGSAPKADDYDIPAYLRRNNSV